MNLILFFSLTSALAAPAPKNCTAFLRAFTLWEQVVGERLVQKTSEFPIPDWDPNSEFDGILLTKRSETLAKPVLEIEFKSTDSKNTDKKSYSSVKAWEHENDRKLLEFQAREVLTYNSTGSLTYTLKDDQKVICTEKHRYRLPH